MIREKLSFFLILPFGMHEFLLSQQFFFAFNPILIGYTTIYGANCRALGFFVKAHTLRTFIRCDIVNFVTYGFLHIVGVDRLTIGQHNCSRQRRTIAIPPFISTFIDCRIWAFGFTGPAIDTFVRYNDCHFISFSLVYSS